jgi:hypothetical protein
MALNQNSWAGPRHELWLSAIRKNAARLRGTASRSDCYAPRSILQVQPAWPFPFSPTFQNALRRPRFASENLSNREGFSTAAHKPRPGPLRAAMLSASPSAVEVQLQTSRWCPEEPEYSLKRCSPSRAAQCHRYSIRAAPGETIGVDGANPKRSASNQDRMSG